ncbi:protein phosphatase 2C-like protein [Pseudobacter ginsenosidimutans]|uniref:Protein phosphatase 2C-like protein n=2 Tax=Pseudobacter ginsenosidimutans TaxID=661488 RepID=A0A4Q7N4W4_9BACT|nr:protein phosphatase 2C-like protein [Pseudobacter ginsenosidimutans]
MDGCTMADESYFASTLVKKLLRKIAQTKTYQEFKNHTEQITIEKELKEILKNLFLELNSCRNQLGLGKRELLTTIVILLVDAQAKTGAYVVVGDGLICIDDSTIDFDQDNKPDYLGFHLHEDFDTWYNSHTQKCTFGVNSHISLATDGIHTFTKISPVKVESKIDVLEYLLFDQSFCEKEDMIELKLKKLEFQYGLKPTDDFSMIRIEM